MSQKAVQFLFNNSLFFFKIAVPKLLAPGTGFVEDNFSTDRAGRRDGFRITQAHDIYCVPYFIYYYISSTSDHWALDPRG